VLPLFGRKLIIMLLAGFLASLFYIALSLIAPTLAVESSLSIMFIPPIYCLAGFNYDSMGAGIRAKNVQQKPDAPSVFSVLRPPLEFLASVSVMMVGLALIREPLGYATLSLPGGTDGIIELFNPNDDGHYTLHIISQSAGALLILGYLLALFRWLNHEQDTGIHPEKKHNPNSAPENAPPLAKPTAPLTPPIPPTKTVSASSTAQDSKTGGKK
jgi:hypothetical protein